MGMSASQARLLSLTTRLTNNELRSQITTNAKLRLAEKSSAASQEYMEALNSQKLVFGLYSENGEYSDQNLTASLIYNYEPLKSQYALINSAGKVLVSAKDQKMFENSDNLHEFLNNYNLLDNVNDFDKYEEALANYPKELEEYNIEKAKYDAEKAIYDAEYSDYKKELEDHEKEYAEWKIQYDLYEANKDAPDLYAMFSGIVGTSETVQDSGAQGHYYRALKNNLASCYLHVLNVLIDYDGTKLSAATKETSIKGVKVTLNGEDGGMTGQMSLEENQEMSKISRLLGERYCDGDDNFYAAGKQNLLEAARKSGIPTDLEILRSDYKEITNADGSYSYEKKTLEQKIIDLYYIIKNKSTLNISNDDMSEMLMNFTDGDMKKISIDPPGDEPTAPKFELTEPGPLPKEPKKPELPNMIVNDKDKAQWYVNLWHVMNNSQTANKVDSKTIKFDDETKENYGEEKTVFVVEDSVKSANGGFYAVLDDNLASNAEWLQFALEHGTVTLAKAQFDNPSANSGKTSTLVPDGISWEKIIYTSASDIQAKDDDVAITMAEIKYKNAMQEIQSEDKKYDQDLKKLDTEHTALQNEYESLKNVISKNVDRSFKAFS